jgi:hypothetical protein
VILLPWRWWQDQRGSQTVEYLLITPLAVALLAAVLGQMALAAVGLITCEAAARDAAVAASRGNSPVIAAKKAAPDWDVKVSGPQDVSQGSYEGVQVTVELTIPALPIRFVEGQSFTVRRTVTMPKER